jgi:HEAT repeat protein
MVVAEVLGRIGDVRAVGPLIAALRDENEVRHVRKAAVEALGRIGDARAVAPLAAALKDGESWQRKAASQALGRIGDARAVEPLLAALGDYWDVRKAAAEALVAIYRSGKLGPEERTLLLAQRSVIREVHRDESPYDSHEDSGIGVEFPD